MRERLILLVVLSFMPQPAGAAGLSLNGGFEASESLNESFLKSAREVDAEVSPQFPQVWQINYGAMAAAKQPRVLRLVKDAKRARSGECALELKPGEVFLPGLPVKGGAKVIVRLWATGQPGVILGVWSPAGKPQNLYPPATPVGDAKPDAKGYVEYVASAEAPADATRVSLTLGAADALLEDLSLEIAGTNVSAPDLAKPLTADADTLALATGEAPLAEGSAFTGKLIDGRFSKAYEVGAQDLLQVPGRFAGLLRGGTIETWFRPHWSGRDESDHSLATLSADGFGYGLTRTRYNHVIFHATDGWTRNLGNVQSQHWQFGNRWGEGDWHHVAVSWTPQWYTLFVDGFPVDTALTTTNEAPNTSWCSGELPSKVTSLVGLGSPGTDIDEFRISRSARYWIVAAEAPPKGPDAAPAPAAEDAKEKPVPLTLGVEPKEPPDTEPAPAPRGQPTTFFVAGTDPNASDDNPGTTDKPFKTINRGVKELLPGDTLTVRGGTYREGLELKLVGTKDHPITIQAAPGEAVVIKGSEVVEGWKRDGDVWRKEGWTKELVEGSFTKGCRLVSPKVMEVFQEDGVRGDAVVLMRVRTLEELREGKCFWDEKTGTITIWPYAAGGFDPNANGVEVPVRGWGLSLQGRFVRVRGLQFRQFGMAAVTNWSSVGVSGKDCVIEDCLVTWADFVGLSFSGFRNVIRRCEASYCGNSGMGGGVGERLLIDECTVTHNNFWRYSPGWHGGGAKIIPWFNKSTVRNSRFAYNYGPGLWFDGSCNDSVIEGNRCHDNEGPGIMVEISRGCLVRNNLCYNNRNSLPGIDLNPLEKKGYAPVDCQARRVEGGAGGNGIFISSSPHSKVYNNLCYRNESVGLFAEWGKRLSSDIADWAERKGGEVVMSTHDVDLRNNLLVNNGGAQLSLRRNGVDEDTYSNRSDYNLLFSSGGEPLVAWGFGGAKFTQLDKWQKASGFDTHGVVAAPVFEFSPGLDLRLQPDSLGVDQGALLPDAPTDADGRKRPLGKAADIGPFEIVGTRQVLERPAVPTNLSYSSIDLSKLVNRAFADEKADDGKGGWSDQGPTTDLSMFPAGQQTFNGVPFTILSPKGCLVLRSGFRPQSTDLPQSVTIPVGRKADVLFFLHSGAWLGGGTHHWSYVVHRGDGTQEEIKVVGGENIRDWSDPNAGLPFDRECPTTTQVAWTGKNLTFDKVSVYMMALVNPHDWCDVTDIEMVAKDGGGVPILLALTGGTRR